MSEPTTIIPVGELIARRIDEFVIEPFFEFLRRRSPLTRHLLMLFAAALLVGSAVWTVWSLHTYSRLMAPTLAQQLETNDMPYKGVEAFLLSAVTGSAEGDWGPGVEPDSLRRAISTLGTVGLPTPELPDLGLYRLSGPQSEEETRREAELRRVLRLPPGTSPGSPDDHSAFAVTWARADQPSYLFLPGIFLPSLGASEAFALGDTAAQILQRVRTSPDLFTELAAAHGAGFIMRAMDDKTIDGMAIAQTYFIGDLGTFAIRDNVRRKSTGFESQFRPTKYFPDRPYFFEAIAGEQRRGSFDYVSPPYIDYAGIGVVRTYSIAFRLPHGHHAILAFDCVVPDGAQRLIARASELRPPWKKWFHLGGEAGPEVFEVATDPGSKRMQLRGDVPVWFRDLALRETATGSGKLTGQITAHADPHDSGTYDFTVPLNADRAGEGGLDWTRFVVVHVDLNDMKRVAIPGALAVLACFFFGGVLNYFFHEHIAERREQVKVLRNVVRVMADAGTPFAWFDAENRFVEANSAMAKWLDYASAAELMRSPSGRRRTFRELLAAENRMDYEQTLARSKRGMKTQPYWCRVLMGTGKYLEVLVHGERMPLEFQRDSGGPHRFGVFLRCRVDGKELDAPRWPTGEPES